MATSGVDGKVRVWDVRTNRSLHSYRTAQPARSLSISQRGLLAAGCNTDVQVSEIWLVFGRLAAGGSNF